MHRFESLAQVAQTLEALGVRELATRLERRPGHKEDRYAHLLGGETLPEAEPPTADGDRVAELEGRIARLERAFEELTARLPDRD